MSLLKIKEFYGQSLGVRTPWKVTEVSIDSDKRQVRVLVECARDVSWQDPETQERAEIKDWQERTWRHLDTCEYETVITAKVPLLILSGGRTIMVSVPWAEAGGSFTLSFVRHVFELLAVCRTAARAARLAGITEDAVNEILNRVLERGMPCHSGAEFDSMGLDKAQRGGDRPQKAARRVGAADQQSISKEHRRASILMKISNGEAIDMVVDHAWETPTPLLSQLSECHPAGVGAAASGMWSAFLGAVEELLPQGQQTRTTWA